MVHVPIAIVDSVLAAAPVSPYDSFDAELEAADSADSTDSTELTGVCPMAAASRAKKVANRNLRSILQVEVVELLLGCGLLAGETKLMMVRRDRAVLFLYPTENIWEV